MSRQYTHRECPLPGLIIHRPECKFRFILKVKFLFFLSFGQVRAIIAASPPGTLKPMSAALMVNDLVQNGNVPEHAAKGLYSQIRKRAPLHAEWHAAFTEGRFKQVLLGFFALIVQPPSLASYASFSCLMPARALNCNRILLSCKTTLIERSLFLSFSNLYFFLIYFIIWSSVLILSTSLIIIAFWNRRT
jgi:hypothetical protein